jgi:hypothetical protein
MPRGKTSGGKPTKRPIERYEHSDKKRINNPPVGLVTPETDPVAPTHKTYDYVAPVPSVKLLQQLDYDPHLDPQLVWAGKKEHSSFEVRILVISITEEKFALVDSIADPNTPRKAAFRGCFPPSIPVENGCRPRIHWTIEVTGIKLVNNAAVVGVMPCLNSLENQPSPPTPSTRFPVLRLGRRLN